jgi:hypothetical protein
MTGILSGVTEIEKMGLKVLIMGNLGADPAKK